MSKSPSFLLMAALFLCCPASSLKAQVFEKKLELHDDVVAFPITIINVYPFISATVNGVEGKFMFDTGYRTSYHSTTTISTCRQNARKAVELRAADSLSKPA